MSEYGPDTGKRIVTKNGVTTMYSGYCDQYGEPIERTPQSHPYSYDSYLLWRNYPNEMASGGVYTDRLFQWDFALTNRLLQKHMGSESQMFDKMPKDKLRDFLRERLENPTLEIAYCLQCCNQASGFPLWFFAFKKQDEEVKSDGE